jgi:hypothetical protein
MGQAAGPSFGEMPWTMLLPVPRPFEEGMTQNGREENIRRIPPTLEEMAVIHGATHATARLDGPAFIPLPLFRANGEAFHDDGVVIYEGMRVVILEEGCYEVRFTVGIPRMPVTMRLQVMLHGDGTSVGLTLPPISLVPARGFLGNYTGCVYEVRQRGYSELLAKEYGKMKNATVTRQGVARFGSWPEGINEFTRLPR